MTGAILDHLWQSTLVACVIGFLTLLFRNNSAGVRHGLWFAASVKFLFPFLLLRILGRALLTHTVAASSIKTLARLEIVTVPFAASGHLIAKPAMHELPWAIIAVAIWAAGFAAIVIYWFVQWARLATIARSAKPVRLNAPVSVRTTSELLEPGLFGIARPVILLPDTMIQRLASWEIDAILAHEICHLRRRDNLLTLIHMLVEAVFWFYPLVWFIGARLTEESERACDESVLDTGKKPLEYAQTILKVCRLTFRSRLPCASGISGSELDRRITAIMVRRGVDDVDPNKILLLAGLGLFAVLTPLITGGLVPAPNAHTMESFGRVLGTVRQASHLTPQLPNLHWSTQHRSAQRSAQQSPPSVTIAAPTIQADVAMIILPEPQLPADSSRSSANASDAPVCRPPQRLLGSRLMGPEICLSKQTWDRYKSQGLVLMPDGRTLVADYSKMQIPVPCMNIVIGASSGANWTTTCRQ